MPGAYTVRLEIYMQYRNDSVTKHAYVTVVAAGIGAQVHYNAFVMMVPFRAERDCSATMAAEGAACDSALVAMEDLAKQSLPSTATLCLDLWAKAVGLQAGVNRDSIIARLTAEEGLSIRHLQRVAVQLGYRVGTHEQVGDPHVRFVRGEFLPFRLGYSRLDIDLLWSQGEGASQWTVSVYGTDVQSTAVPRAVALRQVVVDSLSACAEAVFTDE
jgi:hypothetical protein